MIHFKVGSGSSYTSLNLIDATKSLRAFFRAVDSTNPYLTFKSVLGKDSKITSECSYDIDKSKTKAGAM